MVIKMKDCRCDKCGNDLYSECNILLETKDAMDKLLNGMDTECVGRPVFVLVIGDNGTDWVESDTLQLQEDKVMEIFKECLQEILKNCDK